MDELSRIREINPDIEDLCLLFDKSYDLLRTRTHAIECPKDFFSKLLRLKHLELSIATNVEMLVYILQMLTKLALEIRYTFQDYIGLDTVLTELAKKGTVRSLELRGVNLTTDHDYLFYTLASMNLISLRMEPDCTTSNFFLC